jgi:hypothetical protein
LLVVVDIVSIAALCPVVPCGRVLFPFRRVLVAAVRAMR